MKPTTAFPTEIGDSPVALARLLQSTTARRPAIAWRGDLQPVPLHRMRVSFGAGSTTVETIDVVRGRRKGRGGGVYMGDPDVAYRDELRMRWHAARLGRRPLEGPLLVVLLFAGDASGRRYQPDFTNLAKAVEDAGNPSRDGGWLGLWRDDKQIRFEAGGIVEWGKGTSAFVALDVWELVE